VFSTFCWLFLPEVLFEAPSGSFFRSKADPKSFLGPRDVGFFCFFAWFCLDLVSRFSPPCPVVPPTHITDGTFCRLDQMLHPRFSSFPRIASFGSDFGSSASLPGDDFLKNSAWVPPR